MGQAFDQEGRMIAEMFGKTKKEVFEGLTAAAPNAAEIRITTLADKIDKMRAAQVMVADKQQAIGGKTAKKPPKEAGVLVTFSCGHQKPASHFKSVACAECRNKAQQAKAAKRREKFEKAQKASKPPEGRLPDGARFQFVYSATDMTWNGCLSWPHDGPLEEQVLNDTGTSVEWLMRNLGQRCRTIVETGIDPEEK